MSDYRLISTFFIFLCSLFIFCPVFVQAADSYSISPEIQPRKIVEANKQMTQEEINDLFGEDPYLGQTSYLQSPDGFNQRDKSK